MLKVVARIGSPVRSISLLLRPPARLLGTEPSWQCLLCQGSIAMGPASNPAFRSPQTHGNRPGQPSSKVVLRSSRPQGPRRPQTWVPRLAQQQHLQPSQSPQQLSAHLLQQQGSQVPHLNASLKQQQQFATPHAQIRQHRARMLSAASHSRQQTQCQPQQQQEARPSSNSSSTTAAVGAPAAANAARPALTRQQFTSPHAELAAARQARRKQQQQHAYASAAASRPTSSSSACASPRAAAAAPVPKQLQQQQHAVQPQVGSYSRGGSFAVIAAYAADSYAAEAEAAAALYRRGTSSSSRTTSPRSPKQAVKASLGNPQSSAGPCQQQQQPQQPLWHVFRDSSSSRSFGSRQQQQPQQQELPPGLQQLPANSGPISVDITHLLSLQTEAEVEDSGTSSSGNGSGSSSSKGQSKLSMLQRQLRALQSQYGQHQQLLWVTVHQLQGPAGPAAVWVKPWAAALNAEQLRVVAGPAGCKDTVLYELQDRPDLGQQPMAVVEGLRFLPGRCSTDSSSSSGSSGGGGSGSNGSSSGSSGVGCVYDCLVLSSGDFSPLEHENMFPNAMVHCGDGRQLHSARGAHDLAAFMAQPELWQVRDHCDNLFRYILQKDGTAPLQAWVHEKLQQRWGLPALMQLGDPVELVTQSLYRVAGMQRRYPRPSTSTTTAAAAAEDQGQGVGAVVGGGRPISPVQAAFAS